MRLDESVAQRLRSDECNRWMHNVASTGYCHNPVRLVGSSTTLHEASGEVLSAYSSSSEPDGLTFTRCGNRRATRCESCSHEYKGDTWHMIMAGAAGGTCALGGRRPAIRTGLPARAFVARRWRESMVG